MQNQSNSEITFDTQLSWHTLSILHAFSVIFQYARVTVIFYIRLIVVSNKLVLFIINLFIYIIQQDERKRKKEKKHANTSYNVHNTINTELK